MRHAVRPLFRSRRPIRFRKGRAFTLVEILVAMVVTLIMLGIVVTIFGMIGKTVSNSRSVAEMTDQLRATKQRLQLDLAGYTVTTAPPRNPRNGEGYLEIIEGPVGRFFAFTRPVPDENGASHPDTTVGDNDDILFLTTQNATEPFVGRHMGAATQSQVAEVAWFVRGTTLYRRQLLVKPELNRTGPMPTPTNLYSMTHPNPTIDPNLGVSYYSQSDVSVHADGKGVVGNADLGPGQATATLPQYPDPLRIVANSLGDLTKRENRFAHVPVMGNTASVTNGPTFGWPFDARKYGWYPFNGSGSLATTGRLGLPTLQECSDPVFPLPIGFYNNSTGSPQPNSRHFPIIGLTIPILGEEFDAWDNPNPWVQVDQPTGQLNASFGYGAYPLAARVGEDIILTNVLSFDIRVWDPTALIIIDPNGNSIAPGDPCPGYGVLPANGGFGFAAALMHVAAGTPGYIVIGRGAYVDLNYGYHLLNESGNATVQALATSTFSGAGDIRSGMAFTAGMPITGTYTVPNSLVPAVYDTWSTHYERDGIDQGDYIGGGFIGTDEGTNSLDDNNNGLIDEDAEQEAPPPYRAPLRGIQIKIRCFDPDSNQIREVTVVQEFLPE